MQAISPHGRLSYMKIEKPTPMIVRFYKDDLKRIKKAAKRSKVSLAAAVRYAIRQTFVDYEND